MKRREFITLLGGAAAAWPIAAQAQQPAMPVIGFLGSTSPDLYAGISSPRSGRALTKPVTSRDGTSRSNIDGPTANTIVYQPSRPNWWTSRLQSSSRIRAAALAAKAATTAVPSSSAAALDPVKAGLVNSLNRPGGNVTGISSMSGELVAKQLELLHELVPSAISHCPTRQSRQSRSRLEFVDRVACSGARARAAT